MLAYFAALKEKEEPDIEELVRVPSNSNKPFL